MKGVLTVFVGSAWKQRTYEQKKGKTYTRWAALEYLLRDTVDTNRFATRQKSVVVRGGEK